MADHHVDVHVGANEVVVIVEVFSVENVNGDHVFGLDEDIGVEGSGVVAEGRF